MLITGFPILLEGISVAYGLLLGLDLKILIIIALSLGLFGLKNLTTIGFHYPLLLESPWLKGLPVHVLWSRPLLLVVDTLDLAGVYGGHGLPVEFTTHLSIDVSDKRAGELDWVRWFYFLGLMKPSVSRRVRLSWSLRCCVARLKNILQSLVVYLEPLAAFVKQQGFGVLGRPLIYETTESSVCMHGLN